MGIPSIDHSNDKTQASNWFRVDALAGFRPGSRWEPDDAEHPTTIVRIAARLASCFYSQNENSAADL
jgi:hypothetical protein